MKAVTVKNLNFTYPGARGPALRQVDFSLSEGQFAVLCGPSGCGKSTLLRHIKPALQPVGTRSGEIFIGDRPLSALSAREGCARIGFVGQSPENQLVTDKVWHELAFGLESLGMETAAIRSRVAETAGFFGMQGWFEKDVHRLSGGQKQLLNLASVMVMEPQVLLLDEPVSQLDPIAAGEFLAAVARLNREMGVTVLMTEHRLEEVWPYIGQLLVMEKGAVRLCCAPEEAGVRLRREQSRLFWAMPTPMRIWAGVPGGGEKCPGSLGEGRSWLSRYLSSHPAPVLAPPPDREPAPGEPVLEADNVWFRYEREGEDVLRGASLRAYAGQLLAVMGGNGTGKSTLLSLLTGENRPLRGKIRRNGQPLSRAGGAVGLLPQNPQTLFTGKTLWEDWEEVLPPSLPKEEREARLREMLRRCGLWELRGRHPYDLSGGEQQRAALGKVLLLRPQVLLLDEPTKGMDAAVKQRFGLLLQQEKQRGVCLLMVSHDVEFCARWADRCALFFRGEVVSENTPHAFFAANRYYTTMACRMTEGILPGVITVEEAVMACGGEPEDLGDGSPDDFGDNPPEDLGDNPPDAPPPDGLAPAPPEGEVHSKKQSERKKVPRGTILSMGMVLGLIPLTILYGLFGLGNEKPLFISLLILLEATLPFFLRFEGRKPKARELVLLAVLCALGVAGRCAFSMLPQCKPLAALVILSGACFGGETGFLTGAVSMLLSNMLFGQGPWTPWQMAAMGLLGFLAGVLCRSGLLPCRKWPLSVFGFLAVVGLYGGMMNLSSLLLSHLPVTLGSFLAFEMAGIGMDVVHGVSTFLFLFFLCRPMADKMERLKTKYGLFAGAA